MVVLDTQGREQSILLPIYQFSELAPSEICEERKAEKLRFVYNEDKGYGNIAESAVAHISLVSHEIT